MNKGKAIQAVGWTTVCIGLYIVVVGISCDTDPYTDRPRRSDDNIFDADFRVIDYSQEKHVL